MHSRPDTGNEANRMSNDTIQHYDANSARFLPRYETADAAFLHTLQRQWLPPEGRVLEIGRGSGRDAWFMAS